MSQTQPETLGQPEDQQWFKLQIRIPVELDAELEHAIAGTRVTKQKFVEAAIRDRLKVNAL